MNIAHRPARWLILLGAAASIGLGACHPSSTPASTGASHPTTSAPTAASSNPHQASVNQTDNGHTVTLAVGERLVLSLPSTYWDIAAARPATVLHTDPPTTSTRTQTSTGRCVTGQGCGAATAVFHATAAGTATITATRQSCGEAKRCTPAQSTYTLTVTVH